MSGAGDARPYRSAPAEMRGGATRLYKDFLHSPEKVAVYFGPSFDDENALAQMAARLRRRQYPREALARMLDAFIGATATPDPARAQLDALQHPDSLVVFAGQQPGLFTGPLYTVYKALTVERWAADLSRLLAVPVIPCFWLADDDHDFDEVDHVNVPGETRIVTLRYTPATAPEAAPVGRITLDRGIEVVTGMLSEHLPGSEFKQAVVETLVECYAIGTHLSVAFGRLWYRMFPRSRLLFVSPQQSNLYRIAAPVLQRAISDDGHLFHLYAETSGQLKRAGYHRQVHKISRQTLLFHQATRRRGIRHDAAGNFVWDGAAPMSKVQLCEKIAERPEDFSPNVLMRPIVQNALFPTLGVVLGPAETAYYAQLGALHDHFEIPRPAILPRTSVTLVERGVARNLSRHAIERTRLNEDLELFPCGMPQERIFNIVYYWARYGPRLLRELHEQWPAGGRDPLIWDL